VHPSFVVIGGGLSGLAAAIRLARFNERVLLLEKHSRVGGLNSYYYRHGRLFETGLHAITNYAEKRDKHAPLNRLLRQLKVSRDEIGLHQQKTSEICFPAHCSLLFSNDFDLLTEQVRSTFPVEFPGFQALVRELTISDPFSTGPYLSTRKVLAEYLRDPLLTDMLLCPILFYGSSWENDLDFRQFTIMFRSIYQEGFFRPRGSIKNLLDLMVDRLEGYGGTLRLQAGVRKIHTRSGKAVGVELESGEVIDCNYVVSTIGADETRRVLEGAVSTNRVRRLGFTESIFQVKAESRKSLPDDRTCVFFNTRSRFRYEIPEHPVDYTSGVISLPFNFDGLPEDDDDIEVRTTNLANYRMWKDRSTDPETYRELKADCAQKSCIQAENIVGRFTDHIVYRDTFTPLTIKRFTSKFDGAIYGSPDKIRDGRIGYDNVILAGTDQGFLGIVGAMLSGVSMVNQHILTKL
jgi:phytoene dehydrogenase-like protein